MGDILIHPHGAIIIDPHLTNHDSTHVVEFDPSILVEYTSANNNSWIFDDDKVPTTLYDTIPFLEVLHPSFANIFDPPHELDTIPPHVYSIQQVLSYYQVLWFFIINNATHLIDLITDPHILDGYSDMAFNEIGSPFPIDLPPLYGPFKLPHGDTGILVYSHDASIVYTQSSSHILMEDEPSNHYVVSATNSLIARFIKFVQDSYHPNDGIGGIELSLSTDDIYVLIK